MVFGKYWRVEAGRQKGWLLFEGEMTTVEVRNGDYSGHIWRYHQLELLKDWMWGREKEESG